ncbi:5-deoxy-glucuronate isomerase [Clostridium uliginosum]|uniref:5-deoxy-glucuronate isomerase n=1 Tax=Clostridium uliginosum TaxID=119641 RepID=A0A1I1N128_9CLOT|nr:5-deoxy-glucuronate isomerase [Clostridium uliginosum]SFC91319.1 5-deoxy-glucuronate isomerase [Clostridium uliginosum]
MVDDIKFSNEGLKVISSIDGINKGMLMDISIRKLEKDKEIELHEEFKEIAVLLIEGKIKINWENESKIIERKNVFEENPYCLHVCKDKAIKITALRSSELLIQATDNEKKFTSKLYTPEDVITEVSSVDIWDSTAARQIKTIFDYSNAPYSNMVMGEIISYPGRWSSYVPHHHPQPEVYYYKFDKPQGFGACFIGDNAYKVIDGSCAAIPGGLVHPQSTAPGYRMYYCWMIRHLEGNPWNATRTYEEAHEWLLKEK